MNQRLRQVYEDLLAGKLTKRAALQRLRQLKSGDATQEDTAALLVPLWRDQPVAVASSKSFAEHQVVLCGFPTLSTGELMTLVPATRCQRWALPAEHPAEAYRSHAEKCFELIQTLLSRAQEGQRLLQIVVADEGETRVFAGLAALLQTAMQEDPGFAGQLLIVPADLALDAVAHLLQAESQGAGDVLVRHRRGSRQVREWKLAEPGDAAHSVFRDNGVYLITGGTGAIGLAFAEHILLSTSSARVVLTGRSQTVPERLLPLERRWGLGKRLSYRPVDLTKLEAVQALITEVIGEQGRLNGILHTAGMVSDQFIRRKSSQEFSQVLWPKVDGTVNLDRATEHLELDFLALFSSIAGAFGNAGQADYATANGFMDHFAQWRNERLRAAGRRGHTLSINWSLWREGGMRLDPQMQALIGEQTGLSALEREQALRAFHLALHGDSAQCLITGSDNTRLRAWIQGQRQPAGCAATPATADAPAPAPDSRPESAGIDSKAPGLQAQAERLLSQQLSTLLKVAPGKIDPQAQMETYGIDSILAMSLTTELQKVFGPLPKTLFFEYQTIRQLAGYIVKHHASTLAALGLKAAAAPSPSSAPAAPVLVPPRRENRLVSRNPRPAPEAHPGGQRLDAGEGIAVVGISGRYPEARDLTAFWEQLRNGKDCVREVPPERWNWRDYYSEDRTLSGHHYSRWGGFIEGVDEFDASFFNISPREAKHTDPQERLFLQHAWMALEDAGLTRRGLERLEADSGADVGVYVGVMYSEYQMLGVEASTRGQRMAINGSIASIANRVSYFLNLHGPSMTLDTMCSSSLTAIHLACQDLRTGRTSLALAGGVNVSIHPNKYLLLSAGQFISSAGQCQSFGEGGNGYIPGEGVGVVVLKRLSDARRDGDNILGVIRGTALSHGGRTNGYSVPNPRGQANAIKRALADAQVRPQEISYIEAHGTGTKLGDPIEIAALQSVFGDRAEGQAPCWIGSVKSNIGHCESAAGIAALTKVLLQMRHREIVPSLHSATLNPHIDFASSPFEVNQQLRPWDAPLEAGVSKPRLAGISSFGAGGSNAHLIVQEYVQSDARQRFAPPQRAQAFVLSARNVAALQRKAQDLLSLLERDPDIDGESLAFTLQTGREAMDERLAIVASGTRDIQMGLRAFLDGAADIQGLYRGDARKGRESLGIFNAEADLQRLLEGWLRAHRLDALAELWVKGVDFDWRLLYGESIPPRMSLPPYPFARDRHWFELPPQGTRSAEPAHLHPLVQRNASVLGQQAYKSRFLGTESFVKDGYLVQAAYFPMLQAALGLARPAHAVAYELRNMEFGEPCRLSEGTELTVYLSAEPDLVAFDICGEGMEVHCRGEARELPRQASTVLDLAALQQALSPLPASATWQEKGLTALYGSAGEYLMVLAPTADEAHVSALQRAVEAGAWMLGRRSELLAVGAVRLLGVCEGALYAYARQSRDRGELDLSLVNQAGQALMVLEGLVFGPAEGDATGPTASSKDDLAQDAVARRAEEGRPARPIDQAGQVPALPPRAKPANIQLAALASTPATPAPVRDRPVVHLSAAQTLPLLSGVQLIELDEHTLSIQCGDGDPDALAQGLCELFDRAAAHPSAKSVLLHGQGSCFVFGPGRQPSPHWARQVLERLLALPLPTIAVIEGDAHGTGFMMAALCDFMLLSLECHYACEPSGSWASSEVALLRERFSPALADWLLLQPAPVSGAQMADVGWTPECLPRAEVQRRGAEIAAALQSQSREALLLLKPHLARRLASALSAASSAENMPAAARGRLQVPTGQEPLRMPVQMTQQGLSSLESRLQQACGEPSRWSCVILAFEPSEVCSPAEQLASWTTLQTALSSLALPVVAALADGAKGLGWLAALLCDASIYRDGARYEMDPGSLAPELLTQACLLFEERFGDRLGAEIMYGGSSWSGADLQARARFISVGAEDFQALVTRRALQLGAMAPERLQAWRRGIRQGRLRSQRTLALPSVESRPPLAASTGQTLEFGPVRVQLHTNGVLVVRMEDHASRNMFSAPLVAGLKEAFATIESLPESKVVVLTGFGAYFASGGTKEDLLAIHKGVARFTDARTFELTLNCRLPVVAAMQGHGIGAGWALGMFADFCIFSERSEYVSPYMGYGFTPGAGATLVFPERLGHDLARETLLTALPVRGRDLAARGQRVDARRHDEVLAAATALAQRLARQPRHLLIALKDRLSERLRSEMDDTCSRELAMHARTFVGRPDTLRRIEERFAAAFAAPAQPGRSDAAGPSRPMAAGPAAALPDLAAVQSGLRALLAEELQMNEDEVDQDTQFIELGMDSVMGVSWIRKVNERFGSTLEAVDVYSYPSLRAMSGELLKRLSDRAPAVVGAEDPQAPAPASRQQPASTSGVAPAQAQEVPDVIDLMRGLLAEELQMSPADIDASAQFLDLGLDSVSGVSWIRRVNERLGSALDVTQVYAYPTLRQLAAQLSPGTKPSTGPAKPAEAPAMTQTARMEDAQDRSSKQLHSLAVGDPARRPLMRRTLQQSSNGSAAVPPSPTLEQASAPRTAGTFLMPAHGLKAQERDRPGAAPSPDGGSEAIAVIGMAGRFPHAATVDEFWNNIAQGRDCISEIPPQRWNIDAIYEAGAPGPGKTNGRWMGVLEDIDCFDPLFFHITPAEAELMDPQQRLVLEACWNAIEHAGHDAERLSGMRCGVYIGCAASDYHQGAADRLSAQGFTGAASSILAARISYFLNLQGPCLAIDTACSSSLVAIANACDSLVSRHSDVALAGGVYVMANPDMLIRTAQAGMLSPDGRCFSFDQRANGFVPGEAVAMVMLKRLSDAQRDGDMIHAVIRGWGVNQDGRTNGITAPNPEAQARLEREVYQRYGIDPARIGLIEAHGTGTKLGDPIEVRALKDAFSAFTRREAFCALGSVKSNIGHTLTAAGVAGFIKLVQALRHRQLPPTIHFQQLNEHIVTADSPFYVNAALRPWASESKAPRMAAVSAFGFSGTNAHVVLEEYEMPLQPSRGQGGGERWVVPLSAKTPQQLRQRVLDLRALLKQPGKELALAPLAHTLQTGRASMAHRAAFEAGTLAELDDALGRWLAGAAHELSSPTARDWCSGKLTKWPQSDAGMTALQRCVLPGYPFARERYWIQTEAPQARAASLDAPAAPPAPVREPAPPEPAVVLLPGWTCADAPPASVSMGAEHVVVLCGTQGANTGEVASLIPADRCLQWTVPKGASPAQLYAQFAQACLAQVRELLVSGRPGRKLLQIVFADLPELALGLGLTGMLRSAGQEHPQFQGQVLLVPVGTQTRALVRLLQAESAASDPVVRYRHERREVLGWTVAAPDAVTAPVAYREDGVYLITGGMGGVGQLLAQDILGRTTRARVVLTGRAALDARRRELLTALGVRASYELADLTSQASVQEMVDAAVRRFGRLDGVLHLAGTHADSVLIHKSPEDLAAVMAPKVAGTYHLHIATLGLPLDFFVLFSSIASALGNAGQADYAAANGFMDQFASFRSRVPAAHGRTLAINWAYWQDGGMRIDPSRLEAIRQSTGLLPLQTSAALAAFQRCLAMNTEQSLVVCGDAERLRAYTRQEAPPPPAGDSAVVDDAGLTERTLQRLKQVFGEVIKLEASRVDPHREFSAYGVDSLMVTKLNAAFETVFGRISKTLVFEYKTLAGLCDHFVTHHREVCAAWTAASGSPGASGPAALPPGPPTPAAPAASAPSQARPSQAPFLAQRGHGAEEPIAIVGLAGLFPQAATLEQFWRNLRDGIDSVTEIPPKRWSLEGFYEPDMMRAVELGRSYSKWGGFVEQFDQFDGQFFGIAPRDAISMDPQERLFLQCAWHALEDAGLTREALRERFQRQVGVFAGITKQGFNLLGSEAMRRERKFHPHTSFGSLANRLSYFLDVTGPSMPIDTMCSSALTAIHEACEHIRRGECQLAFAGGVNLYTHPSTYVDMATQYALSADGRCRSFGKGANGFVPGEGVGVVLLRPLSAAQADGDLIHGLILSTHVNHGGKTNGYTVPNPRAQAELVARGIEKAGIRADAISYIEAHGTGTELGDPIEIEGLRQAFARSSERRGFCRIGSVKANIGHLEAAAGMAGLTKILLQMKHRTLVPSLHASELNPAIDFESSPFVVNKALSPWNPVDARGNRQPRIAGVSSFGAGGANAHVLVQEYDAPVRSWPAAPEVVVPLSALNEEALQRQLESLLRWLESSDSVDLTALAYTLQTGREGMQERLALVVTSLPQLRDRLQLVATGRNEVEGVFRGRLRDLTTSPRDAGMQAAMAQWLEQRNSMQLAQWWARGVDCDWRRLYPDGLPGRISLPGYPFAPERHWIPEPAPANAPPADVQLHASLDEVLAQLESSALDEDQARDLLNQICVGIRA